MNIESVFYKNRDVLPKCNLVLQKCSRGCRTVEVTQKTTGLQGRFDLPELLQQLLALLTFATDRDPALDSRA